MASSFTLVGTHITSVIPTARDNTINISSGRKGSSAIPENVQPSDVLPEHATEASVFYDPQIHILLRVLHGRQTIELVSLSIDVPPIRFTFSSPLIPSPAVIFDDPEIHIIACTVSGSVYRLVFPLPYLWSSHYLTEDWRSEYLLKHPVDNLLGPVHVKEAGGVFIALKDGGILNLDAIRRPNDSKFLEWNEIVLRPPVSLSLSSFIPFQSRNQPGSSQTIVFATIPNPSPSLVVFSLQRDRIVRVWETGGCVASITMAPSSSTALSRTVPILDAEPRRLLQVLPPEDIFTDDGLRLVAFMPSSTGGYFSVLSLSAKNSSGLRSLQLVGTKECSEQSRNRHFRDYMIINGILWVLWNDEGNPALEYTELDVEEDDQAPWKSVSPAPGIDFSPTHFEDHLFNHRSFAGVFLSTLLRPGFFSKYTLRAALQQYSTVLSSFQGSHTRLLTSTYDSLTEHIAAVVGSTVTLALDPQTEEQLWNPYWNALKRDWEGFVARCREIERNARWPLSLGLSSHGEPLVVERERLSAVVVADRAMQFHETTKAFQIAVDVDPGAPDIFSLMQLAFSIRSYFNPLQSITIDQAILDLSREESPLPYLDRAAQFSNRHITNILTVEAMSWLEQNLDKILDLEATIGDVLNILTGLDDVKLEEDDGDAIGTPQMPWQAGLTAAYITSTIQYRQALTLQIFALLAFIADVRPHTISSEPSVIGQALAAIQCISALHHVSMWPAGDPEAVSASFAEDDVASLMQSMHVSGNSTSNRYGPTYSLLHLLLIPTPSFPLSRTSYISPSVSAHQFLSANGLLRTRSMSTVEMCEVQFLNQILKLGQAEVAREMLEWFPRSPAITYLLGRALLDCGRSDDAASLLERVEHSVGSDRDGREGDFSTLIAVLPSEVDIDSRVSYFRHLVALFEARSLSSDVIRFAKLAIDTSDPNETQDLWLKVFKAHLDLALYEDAYIVLVSTPFPELQREFIRLLVATMCDNDEISRLVSLNFIGYQADVESTLAFKARNTDPRQTPQYAHVLHAWYVFRGDFRSAAAAMYQHGRHLAEIQGEPQVDFIETASAQAMSYLAAINALSLVDSKNAWIEFAVPPSESNQKRRKLSHHIPDKHFANVGLDIDVVSLAEMKQEYVLVISRLEVYKEFPDIHNVSMSAEDVVARFLQAGMIDSALSAARSLKIDMCSIFGSLAAQCMRLAQRTDDDLDPAETPWLLSDQVVSWEGSNLQRAWRYLRIALETHDTLDNDWVYRKVSFQKILDLDRFSRVPAWLVKFFEDNQPEYLIRTYLKYGLVRQALNNALIMVRKASLPLVHSAPKQASSTWLPYNLIDQVLLVAAEEQQQQQVSHEDQGLSQQLRNEIATRTQRIKKWTEAGR